MKGFIKFLLTLLCLILLVSNHEKKKEQLLNLIKTRRIQSLYGYKISKHHNTAYELSNIPGYASTNWDQYLHYTLQKHQLPKFYTKSQVTQMLMFLS